MTATIEAAGYTLNAQNQYVRSGFDGERYITLNILGVCTIGGGCGAFGLQGLDQQGRIAAFRAWDLTTLSMFIASGADLNEQITIDSSENTPLDLVADSYDNNAASNLTIFGSVLRNAGGVCNEFATSIDPEHVEVCGTKLITTEVIEQIATRRASGIIYGCLLCGGVIGKPKRAKSRYCDSDCRQPPRISSCKFCNSRVCALCVVRCALCVVRCALCVVRCALCVVRCALCVVRCALMLIVSIFSSIGGLIICSLLYHIFRHS